MQDTPKVTSEVTPQSMYVEYYMHSFLSRVMGWKFQSTIQDEKAGGSVPAPYVTKGCGMRTISGVPTHLRGLQRGKCTKMVPSSFSFNVHKMEVDFLKR